MGGWEGSTCGLAGDCRLDVSGICACDVQVDTLFYLFGSKERGLNVQHMYKVLSRHPGNCLHIVYEYQVEPRKNILECIKECTRSASPDR